MTDEGVHHLVSDAVPMVIIVSMIIASVSVIKLIVGALKNRSLIKAQTEFQNKMIEKFATAEEFTAYLKSDAGQSFFDKLTIEPAKPLTKILASIQKGTILTLVGIGLFFLSPQFPGPDLGGILTLLGVLSTAVGLGFLISSGISYKLAKSWGMIAVNEAKSETEPPVVASAAPEKSA